MWPCHVHQSTQSKKKDSTTKTFNLPIFTIRATAAVSPPLHANSAPLSVFSLSLPQSNNAGLRRTTRPQPHRKTAQHLAPLVRLPLMRHRLNLLIERSIPRPQHQILHSPYVRDKRTGKFNPGTKKPLKIQETTTFGKNPQSLQTSANDACVDKFCKECEYLNQYIPANCANIKKVCYDSSQIVRKCTNSTTLHSATIYAHFAEFRNFCEFEQKFANS